MASISKNVMTLRSDTQGDYFGWWMTKKMFDTWVFENGDWKGMVDRVHASTLEGINIVKNSGKVVSPSVGVNLFNSLAVSVFRYSAALIPWAASCQRPTILQYADEFFTCSGRLAGIGGTWNHGNHRETVTEEERSNFLTVANWRTLCQGERILRKHNQVLWRMELRDVRKISREKMGGEQKIPWLLCKRMSSTDQNENLNVVGKDRNQEVRVCLPRTVGISLDDNTILQKYLDLVDCNRLDIFQTEFESQENMK